jgi:hypothetical protein
MVYQSPIPKKGVSFHEEIIVRAALHRNDYSEEEAQATWLNAADGHRIRRENRFTVEMMNRRGTIDEDEYSRRGLEYRTRQGNQIRRDHRSAAVRVVLNEQYKQQQGAGRSFIDEEEQIAKVYKVCTSRCQISAQLSALSDARLLDVEFNNLNTKLYPEISFSQTRTVQRGRILRRIFGTAA